MDARIVPKTRAFSRRLWAKCINTNMPEPCAEKQCGSAGAEAVGSRIGCLKEPSALSPVNWIAMAFIQAASVPVHLGTSLGASLLWACCEGCGMALPAPAWAMFCPRRGCVSGGAPEGPRCYSHVGRVTYCGCTTCELTLVLYGLPLNVGVGPACPPPSKAGWQPDRRITCALGSLALPRFGPIASCGFRACPGRICRCRLCGR